MDLWYHISGRFGTDLLGFWRYFEFLMWIVLIIVLFGKLYLWNNSNLTPERKAYIWGQHSILFVLERCIKEFWELFHRQCVNRLRCFIENYIHCGIKPLESFAGGLTPIKDDNASLAHCRVELASLFCRIAIICLTLNLLSKAVSISNINSVPSPRIICSRSLPRKRLP